METIIETALIITSNLIMYWLGYRIGHKMSDCQPPQQSTGPFISSKVTRLRKPKIQSDEKAYWKEREQVQRWD